ncbi:hypothetical protein AAHA92_01352 [Salvia divinorum]|uniref:Uncharacterized protein n=1 Tax=Salvia divinorum TaxID=28513 RepID=A0ABD1IQH7_SALDI
MKKPMDSENLCYALLNKRRNPTQESHHKATREKRVRNEKRDGIPFQTSTHRIHRLIKRAAERTAVRTVAEATAAVRRTRAADLGNSESGGCRARTTTGRRLRQQCGDSEQARACREQRRKENNEQRVRGMKTTSSE